MNPIKLKSLIDSTRQHMIQDLEWSIPDADAGMGYLTMIMTMFARYKLPMHNEKFPELLRILANLLQEVSDVK
jgi:hypothetical protein